MSFWTRDVKEVLFTKNQKGFFGAFTWPDSRIRAEKDWVWENICVNSLDFLPSSTPCSKCGQDFFLGPEEKKGWQCVSTALPLLQVHCPGTLRRASVASIRKLHFPFLSDNVPFLHKSLVWDNFTLNWTLSVNVFLAAILNLHFAFYQTYLLLLSFLLISTMDFQLYLWLEKAELCSSSDLVDTFNFCQTPFHSFKMFTFNRIFETFYQISDVCC